MDTKLPFRPPASDVHADFDHTPTPLITAIRRDQMPEDIRSAFYPQDIILIKEPERQVSAVSQTLAQARGKLYPIDSNCPWCRADDACSRLIVALATMVCLAVASVHNVEIFAFYAIRYVINVVSIISRRPNSLLAFMQYGTETYDSIDPHCTHCAKPHRVHRLASCILSPSTLLLLQQPMLNIRSFFRYYQFFTGTKGQTGGLSKEEVDSCIRHHTAQGALSTVALIVDGSHALLGLEPYRDRFTDFRWGFSWPIVLYQSYRDWKRWRLATLFCGRIQAGESAYLQLGDIDGHSPLDGLDGGGSHKWFLVDPKLFSSRLRCQLGAEAITARQHIYLR